MATNLNQRLGVELKETSTRIKKLILQQILTENKKPEPLYNAARHLVKVGGKMLRPYLTIKACESVGGRAEDALPAAAAIELLHTFTLIHDDIIDNDNTRRGVPAVHIKWGTPSAIVAGDLLFAYVYYTLAEKLKVQTQNVRRIIVSIANATVTICEGQLMDMSFQAGDDISEQQYITMINKKTASLFKAAAEIGGLAGAGAGSQVRDLGLFAESAGIAFQIADDILGIEADEKILGKPVGSDLREGKKILPVIHALKEADSKQKIIILKSMRNDSTREDFLRAKRIMEDLGSIEYSEKKMNYYLNKALKHLDKLPDTESKKSLSYLAKFLINRKY